MRQYRYGGFLNYFHEQLRRDRITTAILTAVATISAILILLMGISVWPAVFSWMNGEGTAAALCAAVFRTNLLLLIVYLVITAVFLLYEHGFSFIKTVLINVCIGAFANLVMLLLQQRLVFGAQDTGVLINGLVWFIASFFFSWILPLLPVMLIGGLGKLIHVIFFKLYEWRHGG